MLVVEIRDAEDVMMKLAATRVVVVVMINIVEAAENAEMVIMVVTDAEIIDVFTYLFALLFF